MRTLLITRHAKSSWEHPGLGDFDRPLNTRGLHDAPRMAQHLHAQGFIPTCILSSSAQRARQTASILADGLGLPSTSILYSDALYLADADTLLEGIAHNGDNCNVLMLVAHNPGVTELVEQLTGEDIGNLPTCAVAVVKLKLGQWRDIRRGGTGELVSLYRPKQLP